MRFLKGLLIGSLVGFAAGSALSEQQRTKLLDATRRQAAPLKDAIKDNVNQVAETVVDETTAKIDAAGDVVADKIASDTPANSLD